MYVGNGDGVLSNYMRGSGRMIDRSIDYLIGDVLSVLNRVTLERIGYFEGSQGLF